MFHAFLVKILCSLELSMTRPEVLWCLNSHFRHVIYGIGPYIADYPKQVLLMCVVQKWCLKYKVFYICVCVWQVWKIKVYSSLSTTQLRWAMSQEDWSINQHIYEEIPNSGTLNAIWNNWESSSSCLHFMYNMTLSDFPTSVAIYSVLPLCRHIWAYHPQSTSPSD